MTYASGGKIEATDYNSLITNVNNIFGLGNGNAGYGGNSINVPVSSLSTVASMDSVGSTEWRNLRNAFADIAAHQGTSLPSALPSMSLLDQGDIVTFFAALSSAANNTAIINNRLNVLSGNLTITGTLTSTRTTPWSTFIRHEFDVVFASPDQARFFFNTGGKIRLNASRTGGSASPQNTSWTDLISMNSPYEFGGTQYFALTNSFVIYRSVSAAGLYTNNMWNISVRRIDSPGPNGSNGAVLRFRSDFLDGHGNVFFDMVDGTFTSSIEEVRSTGVFVRPTPTFTTITGLAAGT